MILTLTVPGDDHALYVQEALRAKGSDTTLWFTADLAQLLGASVEISEEKGTLLRVSGPDLDLGAEPPRVVWLRRPALPVLSEDLHPADRDWARKEYGEFQSWLLRGLPQDAYWINAYESDLRARSKLTQQQAARQAGLRVPRTLYSNDPQDIRAFVRAHGGRAVYKGFTQSGAWKLKDGVAVLFTALLTEDRLPDDDVLRATPGIYQPCLPKAYELRVTVIGRHVFSARLDSQAMEQGSLDWRREFGDLRPFISPHELPPELTAAILRLMAGMGLVFGCLDFIVTPQGECFFLEVNPAGQFLFVEEYAEVPLLDAFCEMLIQGRPDFVWEPARVAVRMGDFSHRIAARRKDLQERHLTPLEQIVDDELSVQRS